jgi:hypothetical protein
MYGCAPAAKLTHGMVGCRVSVSDMAARPLRVLSNDEIVYNSGKRLTGLCALRAAVGVTSV